ncbi:hypothetical protein [Chitinophaga sp. Cy-1792]|uniref:hypothetical protein n=1 Tax=Chitinophaga sp. Cy-1792 TaxID=2608339 RepID=UPI001421CC44|nr:hypothetical protein [Chitinophaga sp. Cy-1792]NIG55116.1 hypothetical protein [Chitinophaga sp. Cy-1792]
MNRIKPWHPFSLLVIIFVILALTTKTAIDLHIHDTYFVIAGSQWYAVLAILSLLPALIYFFTKKLLYSNILTWTHILGSFATVLFSYGCITWSQWKMNQQMTDAGISYTTLFERSSWDRWAAIGVLLLLLLQFVFFYNLIAGVIISSKKK